MVEYVEEFLKIDWKKGDAAISDYLKQKSSSDSEKTKSSFDFRLLRDSLFENCIYINEEEEDDKIKKPKMKKIQRYVAGYNPNIRLQMTCFSKPEMRKLFTYMLKEKNNELSDFSESDQMAYNMYMHTALKEQEQYAKLAASHWSRLNYNRIFHINESIKPYMDEFWKKKIDTIKQHYPKAYKPISSISFMYEKHDDNQVYITHLNDLQIQKSIKLIEQPELWKHVTVPILYQTLISGKNPSLPSVTKQVACDTTALEFAQAFKADVVISASALKTLANNLPLYYTTEWNIVVTVKEVQCGNRKKKVVFVDKPLPPSTLTNTEYSAWHAKLACKMLFAGIQEKNNRRSGKRCVQKKNVNINKKDNNDFTTCESSTESCASEVSTDNCVWKMGNVNFFENYNDNWTTCESDTESYRGTSGSECSLPSLKSEKKQTLPSRKTKNMDSPQGAKLDTSASSLEKEGVKNHCQQSDYSYRLWKLQSNCNSSDVEVKQKRFIRCDTIKIKPLTVITRNKVDGFIFKNGFPKDTIISSKLEYQPDLGAESMLQGELIKEWIDLLLTPRSWLNRVRVSYKGEYIMTEEKKISDLEAEALRLHQFDLQSVLKTIHILLCQLYTFKKPGEYLVMHSSNDGGFAHVYTSVPPTTQCVFSLHDFYDKQWTKRLSKEQRVPWRPLDMTIFTPMHYHLEYVPGTYKPKYLTPRVLCNNLSKVKNNALKTVRKRTQNKELKIEQTQVKPRKED